jgi:hypothetical protein
VAVLAVRSSESKSRTSALGQKLTSECVIEPVRFVPRADVLRVFCDDEDVWQCPWDLWSAKQPPEKATPPLGLGISEPMTITRPRARHFTLAARSNAGQHNLRILHAILRD